MTRGTGEKQKKPKKRKLLLAVAAVFLLLILVILASVNIRSIEITGCSRYSEEQMTDMLFPERKDRNAVYSYFKNLWGEKQSIPFVETYELVYHSPVDVEVIVYEKAVTGYVEYMSSYMYFDRDGIVVESTSRKIDGIPWITGLEFGQIVLYQPLQVKDGRVFKQILDLTQLLSTYGLEVDRILFNTNGDITLYMDEIQVELGSGNDIDGKISELNNMLPRLEGKSGTLYLDTYDETDSDQSFSLIPK